MIAALARFIALHFKVIYECRQSATMPAPIALPESRLLACAPAMSEPRHALDINRAGWNQVAHKYQGRCALPEYGPLTPTEDELKLLDSNPQRLLELGCGSGHSLRYFAQRGAIEIWGIDLSPVQIAFAKETLAGFDAITHLIESPMT